MASETGPFFVTPVIRSMHPHVAYPVPKNSLPEGLLQPGLETARRPAQPPFRRPVFSSSETLGTDTLKPYTGRHDSQTRTGDDMTAMADFIEAVAARRDKRAFAELFDFYAPRIKGVLLRAGANPQEAEEVMQETMVLIWRKAEQFDRTKASPSAWIYTIARNRRIDLIRKERRPELDPEDPFFKAAAEVPDGEEAYEQSQRSDILEEHLKLLPPEQLTLVQKAFYEDMTHQEIADETGLPLGTVKSRIRIALRDLRAKLTGFEL
jgi:RNA polymerase sigma-70 factor (ECF subfamily)